MKLNSRQVVLLLIGRSWRDNEGFRKLHSLFPYNLVPYKHYVSDLISSVLDGDIMPEDTMIENYLFSCKQFSLFSASLFPIIILVYSCANETYQYLTENSSTHMCRYRG